MEAIRLIKQKGGLAKTNPNEIRPKNDEKRTSAVKRALDSNEDEDGMHVFIVTPTQCSK